jgi:hypothetical protein
MSNKKVDLTKKTRKQLDQIEAMAIRRDFGGQNHRRIAHNRLAEAGVTNLADAYLLGGAHVVAGSRERIRRVQQEKNRRFDIIAELAQQIIKLSK